MSDVIFALPIGLAPTHDSAASCQLRRSRQSSTSSMFACTDSIGSAADTPETGAGAAHDPACPSVATGCALTAGNLQEFLSALDRSVQHGAAAATKHEHHTKEPRGSRLAKMIDAEATGVEPCAVAQPVLDDSALPSNTSLTQSDDADQQPQHDADAEPKPLPTYTNGGVQLVPSWRVKQMLAEMRRESRAKEREAKRVAAEAEAAAKLTVAAKPEVPAPSRAACNRRGQKRR